jgi:hypothetical protein
VAEAKKGGDSKDKGAKGKKPKGKDSDSQSAAKKKTPESKPEESSEQSNKEVDKAEAAEAISSDVSQDSESTAAAPAPAPAPAPAEGKMQQQHVSRILDAVLDEPQDPADHHGFKHPLFLDVILAVGLLVAMAGFSIGMFKIYITHSAKQSINQQNYRAAIALLKGTPLPGFFNIAGSEDSVELLNRALYLDAISKLEINRDDASALEELQQIRPGSGYFELAQDLLRDNSPPPKLQLEGGASHDAAPNDPEVKETKPIVPDDDMKDASP